jgi:alpha-soluble NSF attachment protein
MDSNLTRFNVKEIWLRQGLCALAMGDYTQASNLLAHTRNIDPTFQTTREAKFLSTLTDAFSSGDVEVSSRSKRTRSYASSPPSLIHPLL